MKCNAPFYVGSTNIYDYQARTGFKRWNTLQASAAPVVKPDVRSLHVPDAEVQAVQAQFGFDYIQARNHVLGRAALRRMQAARWM